MPSQNDCLPENLHKFRYWVGIPVAFGTLVFITHRIWTNWIVIRPAISQIKVSMTLEGLALLSLSAALLGWNWVSVLLLCGMRIPRFNGMRVYFLANLTRYMPGGIWHFAGRTLWLIGQGYNSKRVVKSLVIEQGIILITGIAVGLAFMHLICLSPLVVTILLLALVSALSSVFRVKHWHLSWTKWFVLIVNYVTFWILYGIAHLCFALAIVNEIGTTNFVKIIGQAAMSWAVGYIVFFVPGGWGIRELSFMHLLSQDFSGNIVFILPILSRLAQILAELICGGIFSLLWHLDSNNKSKSSGHLRAIP